MNKKQEKIIGIIATALLIMCMLFTGLTYANHDITLKLPPNNTNVYNPFPTMGYYVIGDNASYTCILVGTNATTAIYDTRVANNGTDTVFQLLVPLQNNSYRWYINCTDTAGTVNNSATWQFNVNLDKITLRNVTTLYDDITTPYIDSKAVVGIVFVLLGLYGVFTYGTPRDR